MGHAELANDVENRLNESCVWLRMICRAKLLKEALLLELIDENEPLCRIVNSSVKTAKAAMTNDKWRMTNHKWV